MRRSPVTPVDCSHPIEAAKFDQWQEEGNDIGMNRTSLMKPLLRRFVTPLLVFGSILFGLCGSASIAAEEQSQAERPRLFVLVVFDQMRGDYLIRWQPHFADGGFRRLLGEGVWFQNCHYPYAGTITGAGHASLLSGCTPSIHGIVANEWYVRGAASLRGVGAYRERKYAPKWGFFCWDPDVEFFSRNRSITCIACWRSASVKSSHVKAEGICR